MVLLTAGVVGRERLLPVKGGTGLLAAALLGNGGGVAPTAAGDAIRAGGFAGVDGRDSGRGTLCGVDDRSGSTNDAATSVCELVGGSVVVARSVWCVVAVTGSASASEPLGDDSKGTRLRPAFLFGKGGGKPSAEG